MAARRVVDPHKVESLAARGLTMQQTADALGVDIPMLARCNDEYRAFDTAWRTGKAKGVALAASKLMEQVKAGNVPAIALYLKHNAGWRDGKN